MIAFWWISFRHVLRYLSCGNPLCPKKSSARIHLFRSVFVSLCHHSLKIVVKLHAPQGQMSMCHLKPYTTVFTGENILWVSVSMWICAFEVSLDFCTSGVNWTLLPNPFPRPWTLSHISFFFCFHLPSCQVYVCVHSYMFVCMEGDVKGMGEFNHTLTDVCSIDLWPFCEHCSRPFGRDINPSIKATSPQGLLCTNTPHPICLEHKRACFLGWVFFGGKGEYTGEPELFVC